MRELCAKQRFGMFTLQEHLFSLSLAIYLAVRGKGNPKEEEGFLTS